MKIKNSSEAQTDNQNQERKPLIDFFALLLEWDQEENTNKENDNAKQTK